jgi:hypothetical protein
VNKEDYWAYGIGGITAGQVARVHAVAVGVEGIEPVELLVYDSDGNLLARSLERLVPGHAATLQVTYQERAGNRMEFYPVIRMVNGRPRRGYIIPSVEVVDSATGRTILMEVDPQG